MPPWKTSIHNEFIAESLKAPTRDATFLATLRSTVAEVGSSSISATVDTPKNLVARNVARKVVLCV